jgi:hypothetical protein
MILDATRPAAELVSPSTCSPCGRPVDRSGPGPRPREDPRRHAGRLPIEVDQGHGRGEDPRRHAGRSAGNLVSPSTCSPCRRRSLTTRAGCRSTRTRATAAGMILDATRPAADRSGPGPRPRDDPRRHAAGCRAGQPLDVLTMPATIAHQAARPSIDADQVTRPREDPRRHAGRLPSWSAPRHAHHARRRSLTMRAGCRSTRTR